MRKIVLVLLSVCCCVSSMLCFPAVSFRRVAAAETRTFQTGDYVEFGSYPQQRVTDPAVIAALGKMDAQWTSSGAYHYRITPGGEEIPLEVIVFADLTYQGQRYRGVRSEAGIAEGNGYAAEQVYWFAYAPLVWRVLDPAAGFLLCEPLIDAIPMKLDWRMNVNTYGDSYLRSWLNDAFLHTAFTREEQEKILLTENPYREIEKPYVDEFESPWYDEAAADRIFPLSYTEILNEDYGFVDYESQWAHPTDYALAQGLRYVLSDKVPEYWCSDWTLRTNTGSIMRMTTETLPRTQITRPYPHSDFYSRYGTRPALKLSSLAESAAPHRHTIVQTREIPATCLRYGCASFKQCAACLHYFETPEEDSPLGHDFHGGEGRNYCVREDAVFFGTYPQSEVWDDDLLRKLNEAPKTWTSFGFYVGDGTPGSQRQSDYMEYADVTLGGEKYRAVKVKEYRPYQTYGSFPDRVVDNDHPKGATYWFRYDPISWDILDREAGLIAASFALDAQPYSYESTVLHYTSSDLRAWLNTVFYDTAFSEAEKELIRQTSCSVAGLSTAAPLPGEPALTDRIFLLSGADVTNPAFGFTETGEYPDYARDIYGTPYADALDNDNHYASAQWILRADDTSSYSYVYSCFGYLSKGFIGSDPLACRQISSIRPALCIDFSRFRFYEGEPYAPEFSVKPGDVNADGRITAMDARLALRAAVGLEILTPEQITAADVNLDSRITAADARRILRAAVGLETF